MIYVKIYDLMGEKHYCLHPILLLLYFYFTSYLLLKTQIAKSPYIRLCYLFIYLFFNDSFQFYSV